MSPRIQQCREAASAGGRTVAKKYNQEWKEQRGEKGGTACLLKYGREYYRAIRARRKAN